MSRRGAQVQVSNADAQATQAAWADRDSTGITLHTLLQAGLAFADAGMHNARRLADQWRGFYNSCNQGEETKLNAKGDHVIPSTCQSSHGTGPRPMRRIRQKGPLPMAPTNPSTVISDLSTENKVEDETVVADVFPLKVQQPDAGNEDPRVLRDRDLRTTAGLLRANPTLPASITAAQAQRSLAPNAERLQRPVWQNQGFGAPEPRPHSLHNSDHSLAQSPEPTV